MLLLIFETYMLLLLLPDREMVSWNGNKPLYPVFEILFMGE